uniref:Uncharacterized protein n=1 Tax=Peronospora matthiolae TaxID=2874970 RepID=A0AAV1U9L9_9STRA
MRLFAIEIGTALTLASVKSDSIAATLTTPAAHPRPQPLSSAHNRVDVVVPERKLQEPDGMTVYGAISSEEWNRKREAIESWIANPTETLRNADIMREAADEILRDEDDAVTAVEKLGSMRAQNKLYGTATKNNPGLPSVEELIQRYGRDDVVNALVTARQSIFKEEETMAEMWWAQLAGAWKRDGKPIAEVAEILKVDQDESLTQKLKMLKGYIGLSTTAVHDTLLDTMTTKLGGEEQLLTFIGRTKMNGDAERGALKLEKLQIEKWKGEDKDPAQVLKLMHMDKSMDALMSPMLDTVMQYSDAYNTKHPDNKFSVLTPIREFLGDEAVADGLVGARQDRHNVEARDIAKKLLIELWEEGWKDEGKSAKEFIAFLRLRGAQGTKRSARMELKVLIDYIQLFDDKTFQPGFASLLKRIVGGDKVLATTLLKAMAEKIRNSGIYDAYKRLLYTWQDRRSPTFISKRFSTVTKALFGRLRWGAFHH